jgi:hypothetical protein
MDKAKKILARLARRLRMQWRLLGLKSSCAGYAKKSRLIGDHRDAFK